MSQEVKEPKKIVLSVLKKQIEDGMKKDELAEFYGLPMLQMTNILKSLGLQIRKFRRPSYIIIDDTQTTTEDTVQTEEKTSEVDEKPVVETTEVSEENANLAESTPEGNDPVDEPFESVEEPTSDTLGNFWK